MITNIQFTFVIIFLIVLVSLQYTLNKVYKELKEIKQIISRNKIN